ncbi:MAG: cysteine desulfurase [Pseudomonadota bacterium]
MSSAQQNHEQPFDVDVVRADFPILHTEAHGQPLVYLDNAATTQKPQRVLDALDNYYRTQNSNVHRGAHYLADLATREFEHTRERLAEFLNATRKEEIVWTRGTTESINLVAQSWGRQHIGRGDRIVVSALEHHANIVPWQLLCEERDAELVVVPISDEGEIDLDAYARLLQKPVKLVAMAHVSNALGTVNPIQEIVRMAREAGAATLVDGAQAVAHCEVDVQAIGCDFYALSSHKLFGPTGLGALWGRYSLLESMPPWQGGGEMIEHVSFDGTSFNPPPFRFEAGTPDISGVIALGAALAYVESLDGAAAAAHEKDVLNYCVARARQCPGMTLVGDPVERAGSVSFLLDGGHPADVGTLLDRQGIAVRTGHHCAQPLMARLGIPGTVRASFAVYNTRDDVDALFRGIDKVKTFL